MVDIPLTGLIPPPLFLCLSQARKMNLKIIIQYIMRNAWIFVRPLYIAPIA